MSAVKEEKKKGEVLIVPEDERFEVAQRKEGE